MKTSRFFGYLFVTTLMVSATHAQQRKLPEVGPNTFAAGVSVLGIDSYNNFCPTFSLEYTRNIKYNFSWGVLAQQTFSIGRFAMIDCWSDRDDGRPCDPYDGTAGKNMFMLSGMGYYRLPVIRRTLFLIGGAGAGAGFRNILGSDKERMDDRVLPYFTLQLQWAIRFRDGTEIRFSPLLISPARYSWSPMKTLGYRERAYLVDLIHLSVGGSF